MLVHLGKVRLCVNFEAELALVKRVVRENAFQAGPDVVTLLVSERGSGFPARGASAKRAFRGRRGPAPCEAAHCGQNWPHGRVNGLGGALLSEVSQGPPQNILHE